MTVAVAAFIFALVPLGGLAASGSPTASDRKICRREESTGSILSRRVCHRRGDWQRVDETRRRAADEAMRSRGATRPASQLDQ
jgi:hypothetical protein